MEQQQLQQEVLCNTSKALVIQSKNTYEAALIAREEYLEGAYKQEEQLVQSEIFQSEENLRRAQIAARSGVRLADKGITVGRSYVGEYCTSLDMAGASLTLVKLDDEISSLLAAPAEVAVRVF